MTQYASSQHTPWRMQQTHLPPALQHWMVHNGSFMQHLQFHDVSHTHVTVLQEYNRCASLTETQLLDLPPRANVWVREVLIGATQEPTKGNWMVAQTLFPRKILTGQERQLTHLKKRALGASCSAINP